MENGKYKRAIALRNFVRLVSKGNPLVQSDQNLVNEIKDDHQATIDYVNTAVGKRQRQLIVISH